MTQVTKEMTIADILAVNENTASIFMAFGMHCLGCPISSGESVEQAAAAHGIDADALIAKLNEFLANA